MNERIIANSTASAKAAFCFDVILCKKTHIRLFEMGWIVLYVFFILIERTQIIVLPGTGWRCMNGLCE